ncbi:SLAM family member 6 isoform X3 [Nycticebus coucang]|uniref:SLAM family member 6 isoform X3 n=1 Tax=Nycticebus coucang TaxID=9470 RepID=UPI00234C1F73|nr:SLAM family member 6 isoform X3 [Nycticebus coucang]
MVMVIYSLTTQTFPQTPPCGSVVSRDNSTPSIVNAVLGESVTLPLKFLTGENATSITWLYNGISIAFISLSEAQSSNPWVTNPKLRTRLTFPGCCSLQLSNLTMEDTGSYRAQITTETSTKFSDYALRIFEKLRNIQVTSHIPLIKNKTCEIHLTCSVENPSDTVLFRWQTSENIHQSKPNFTIFWNPQNSSEDNYTCVAENAVSNLSFSVSAQALCKDSRHFSPQQAQGPALSLRNTENASVPPESSTVYASVTHPTTEMESPTPMKNNDPVTIYSTINPSRETKPTSPRATALDHVV